jgi:outer membrane protein TolC
MKRSVKYIIVLTISLLVVNENVFAQDNIQAPINDYLKIAAENNPGLKSAFNQYLAALERMPQARALPDPTIMFSLFISPVETRLGAQRAGISLSQAFPWFGQLKSQEMAAAQTAQAQFETFEEMRNELFFKVRSTYYDLYVLEATIAITGENIRLLQSFRELANVKLESAKGSAVDLLRVEMDLADLENQLKYLEDSRLPFQAEFKELLNTENTINIQLPDTLATLVLEKGKNESLDSINLHNPGLRKFDFQINALESEIDVARKMGLPSFSLGMSYTIVTKRTDMDVPDNGKDMLTFPQVGVRIPIYRKKYQAMISERQFLKTSVSDQKENRINQLAVQLDKTWRDYLDAERRVGLYLNLTRLANQVLNILVTQYTSAGSDFEELLRMERQLLRYELELEKARADQNTAVAYIYYLTGKHF